MNHKQYSSGSTRKQIRENIEEHRLTDEQIAQLMKMQSDADNNNDSQKNKSRRYARARIAASMAACLTLAISVSYFVPRAAWDLTPDKAVSQQELLANIAEEVIKNHLKLKPLDIKTQSIVEAQTFFKHLDFMPIDSLLAEKAFAVQPDDLLGGRYCSIQGTTAAQLRYQDNQAELKTLYQVPYDPALYGKIPRLTDEQGAILMKVKGLNIRLWQERGLMMVLVSH